MRGQLKHKNTEPKLSNSKTATKLEWNLHKYEKSRSKCQVVQQSSQLHTSSPNWTVCRAPNWQHLQTCFSQFQASANDYQLYTATLHKPIVFSFLWNPRTQASPDSPYPMLVFWFSWNARTQTSPDSPYSSQFHVSLESQNPDLARQPLFHAYFPTSHGMPEPRPRQTAPIPISFTFLSSLQKLFSEPMHVCKPAHVWTLQRLAIWSTFWLSTTFPFVCFGTYASRKIAPAVQFHGPM